MPIRECAPSKHVYIGIPCYTGEIPVHVMHSLLQEMQLLGQAGILAEPFLVTGNCYLDVARNQIVSRFLNSKADDLLFWDADVAVESPGAAAWMMGLTRPVVAGIYPKKLDVPKWPVMFDQEYMVPNSDGTIPVHTLPTGFMRLNRQVFADYKAHYQPPDFNDPNEDTCTRYFRCEVINGRYNGEDFLFTHEWQAMGGECWALPDIDFAHYGLKGYRGNYYKWAAAEAQRRQKAAE